MNYALKVDRRQELVPNLKLTPFSCYIPELDLTYEMTNNIADMFDYFFIRSECYKNDLGLKGIPIKPDGFDAVGKLAIIRKGNELIGGARTIISTPQTPNCLPLEKEGFSVCDRLPGLELKKHNYCEMSGIAILPEYRLRGEALEYLIRFIFAFLERNDTHYLFSHAPIVQTRIYRKITTNLGYNFEILKDLEMPVQKIYTSLQKVFIAVMPFDPNIIVRKSIHPLGQLMYQPYVREV